MKSLAFILLAVLLTAGCAGRQTYSEGLELIGAGNVEAGLAKIDEASKIEPDNREYRQQYFRQRDIALQRTLALAEAARAQGQYDAAEGLYRRMLALDAANARARTGIDKISTERRHRALLIEAEAHSKKGEPLLANAKARAVLSEDGNHREAQQLVRRIEERALKAAAAGTALASALRKPMTIEYRDASLQQIIQLISQQTGLNFIFDREVRQDLRTSVYVRNTSMEDVLRFVLVTNQLERKVLNENTVLIYPNTATKNRDYQDLVVRSFYLANADVKQVANTIKTLVKTKDLVVDEKLNLLLIRDTPDAVRMAERLIANQDLAEPEVVLEVEVLEVGSNVLNELGIRWPDQFSYSIVGSGGNAGTVTLPEWLNRNSGLVRLSVTNPFLALNFRNQLGEANLLANPRIRVRNRERAKVHIGDKVPVITTTTTATGFLSESVNYLDVGLKLDVEPLVYLENEVGMKVGLEVSSIVREVRSTTGTLTYQVGTRTASTALRLKDGETQMLAGLISDEERKTANQVPGLGSIPVVGRLFGSHSDTSTKTEIVLLITPRIVRTLARPEPRFEEFPGGTESAIGAPPLIFQSMALSTVPALATPLASIGPAATNRITLSGPATVAPGGELVVHVALSVAEAVRSGLMDLTFDPGRLRFVRAEPGSLLVTQAPQTALRTSAQEKLGRLNLSFSGKTDVRGEGELARVVFQALGSAVGTPLVGLEAVSLTDSAGKVISAPLPPPFSVTVNRN